FAIATGARVRPAPETCLAPDLFPQRHPGEGRDPVHRAAKAEVDVWRDRVHALRSEASRADRMRRARRDVHGSRPVPSGALTGTLGAGMTFLLQAIASPTNVIPAKAGTQYTGQQRPRSMFGAIGCMPCDRRRRAPIACDVHAVTCMGPGLFPRAPCRAPSAPG